MGEHSPGKGVETFPADWDRVKRLAKIVESYLEWDLRCEADAREHLWHLMAYRKVVEVESSNIWRRYVDLLVAENRLQSLEGMFGHACDILSRGVIFKIGYYFKFPWMATRFKYVDLV